MMRLLAGLTQALRKPLLKLLLIGISVGVTYAYAGDARKISKNSMAPKEALSLAAMLIKDGVYQRALLTLNELDSKQDGLDLGRYYTLSGIAHMGLKNHPAALQSFNQAVQQGQNDPLIFVYLAETHYTLKDYKATLAAIAKSNHDYKNVPSLLEMKIQSHWLLGQKAQAWEAIGLAQTLFPNESKYLQRQALFALDMGLYQHAAELGQRYLANAAAKAEDYVAIGNALRLNRQFEAAATLLETARLRYPEHANTAKVLAHTYIDQGMHLTAANILEEAARYHPELLSEAAELHKSAGNLQHALFLNARIADPSKKLKQRLGIYLGLKNYEMILNMESNLARHRLLEDQSIRYALAYAAYTIGDFGRARQHLGFVKEPNLFKQATELQRLMQACSSDKLACS